ncbi:hypothetical protein N7644_07530 [Acinetobacter courvalinii]|uniref:Uncharacterized protein n=2 Tax=Acinetobacter courvalinii TaxID=280147 RepID=A0AA42I6P1_9GAMM|nr:hypothetical protein [Acinetobacter courvalinii]MDH0563539.1 hypothetical protein [Acinetobacter courvalinii]
MMNDNVGVVVFYLLCLFAGIVLVIGSVVFDTTLLFVGLGLIACAFLIKSEFNLTVMFWHKIE